MSRYVRKDSRAIYLPGHGKIKDDRIIEGDYDKYVPSVLIRLSDELPARIHEAVTEVFPVPQLRAPVTAPPPTSVAPPAPPATTAQVVAPPLPDSIVIPPPFVEPDGTPVGSEPIESNESSDSGVDDKMATRDQAAAVVAKMKKARR